MSFTASHNYSIAFAIWINSRVCVGDARIVELAKHRIMDLCGTIRRKVLTGIYDGVWLCGDTLGCPGFFRKINGRIARRNPTVRTVDLRYDGTSYSSVFPFVTLFKKGIKIRGGGRSEPTMV